MSGPARRSRAHCPVGSGRAVLLTLLLLLLHSVLVGVLGLVLAPALLGGQRLFDAPPGAFLFVAVTAALDLVLAGLLLLRWNRLTLADLGWGRPGLRDLLLGLLGALVGAGLLLAVIALHQGAVAGTLAQVRAFTPAQRALFLLMGLYAALWEETVFRGYLQPSLQAKLGRAGGWLGTAVFFALYPLTLRPLALLTRFTTGLALGALRLEGRSLWPPAIAHLLLWVALGTIL